MDALVEALRARVIAATDVRARNAAAHPSPPSPRGRRGARRVGPCARRRRTRTARRGPAARRPRPRADHRAHRCRRFARRHLQRLLYRQIGVVDFVHRPGLQTRDVAAPENSFDVIVVGGGHAGCEAAAASARVGARTLLLTHQHADHRRDVLQPGHRRTGQGPSREGNRCAGRGDGARRRCGRDPVSSFEPPQRPCRPRPPRPGRPRALPHRDANRAGRNPGLAIAEGGAEDLLVENGRIAGVVTADGQRFRAAAVVVTTGTFLRGLIHIGETKIPAGRVGEAPAMGLSARFEGDRIRPRSPENRHAAPARRAHHRLGGDHGPARRRRAVFFSFLTSADHRPSGALPHHRDHCGDP